MKKNFVILLVIAMMLSLLVGCGSAPVVSDQPSGGEDVVVESAVKTGIAIVANAKDSTSATAEAEGAAKYDVTLAAVTVDANGVILSCALDAVGATLNLDANGVITSDKAAAFPTKNELGADYGMVAYGGAIAEWDAQAAALCDFAVGKTVSELKAGAVDEGGRAPVGSDLASSATIYLGGYVSAIEAAVNNATELGADVGDELALVVSSNAKKSADATAEAEGNAQLYVTAMALTSKDGVITSCFIDAVQVNVGFDTTGTITTDLTAPVLTKNQLGADYGMVAYGGAIAEWDAQAAAFARYVTGKTAAEVSGIALDESTAPVAGTDLASSVTIKIGDFVSLIEKALA